MKQEFNQAKKPKVMIEKKYVKVPNHIFNVLETLTTGEIKIIKYFLQNQSNVITISPKLLAEKLDMSERNIIRGLKGLINQNLITYNTKLYQVVVEDQKEIPTEDENIGSGESLPEADVPHEEIEITQPEVKNEPKKEQIVFVDENGNEYTVKQIREIFDVTFLTDIPTYRTYLVKYGATDFFQQYGKDYFFPEELPMYYQMAQWYLKNN